MALGAAAWLHGEPLTARSVGGGLVALLGLVVVFWSSLRLDAPLLGMLAILGGIAAATFASLGVKRHAHDVHPVVYNGLGAAMGSVLLVPLAFALGDGLALPPSPPAWAAFAFLVVAGSMVAFVVWAWLLQRWPATRLSFQTVLSPLIAVALGAALLAEPVEPRFLLGTALVLAGTWLAVRARAPAPAAAVARKDATDVRESAD